MVEGAEEEERLKDHPMPLSPTAGSEPGRPELMEWEKL